MRRNDPDDPERKLYKQTNPDLGPLFGSGTLPAVPPEQAHARATDPETSHEAAADVSRRLTANQEAVLRLFRRNRLMTDVGLLAMYAEAYKRSGSHFWPQQSPSGLRTRRKELTTQRWLRDSGERALVGGRHHIVWGIIG